MTMVSPAGPSYGLNVQHNRNVDNEPVITYPWQGGANNELWAINQDGSITSALVDSSGAPLYLAPAVDGAGLVISLQKYYWTLPPVGGIGAMLDQNGAAVTADTTELSGGYVSRTTPASDSAQLWWLAPNIQRVVPQMAAWRYIVSTLTDADGTAFVLTVEGANPGIDDQAIVLAPMAANSPGQLWQITNDGRLLSAVDTVLLAGVNPIGYLDTQWATNPVEQQQWTLLPSGLIKNAGGEYLTIDGNPTTLLPYLTPSARVLPLPPGDPPGSFLWQLVPTDSLTNIVGQAPIPFIQFSGAQEDIYLYLCKSLGVQDLRAKYVDLTSPIANWQTDIGELQCPAGFDQTDWSAVIAQLNAEMTAVSAVVNFFNQYQTYQGSLSSAFSNQLNTVGPQANFQEGSTTSVVGLILSIFEGIAYAILEAVPGVDGAVSAASVVGNVMEAAVNIGTNAANVKSTISPTPFQIAYANLWTMVSDNFSSALDACGQMETVMLSDWGKLQAFQTASASTTGLNSLSWSPDEDSTLVAGATPGMQVTILQMLLPSVFEVYFYTDDDSGPVSDVPAEFQWVGPQDPNTGLYTKYWIATQEDWEIYPGDGVLNTYVWGNGVSRVDFFTSQNGWAFLTADWYGPDTCSLTICNQTPNILNVASGHQTVGTINQPRIGPYSSYTAVFSGDFGDITNTITDDSGATVAVFSLSMKGWSVTHAKTPSISVTQTGSGYALSSPLCNAGDVADKYSSAAQITISYTNG